MDKIKNLEEKIANKKQQLLRTKVWFIAVRLRMEIPILERRLYNLTRKLNGNRTTD